jgi:hypothetical protein
MPSVTFDGQSLSVKGRRVWLTACEFHYALIPMERWGDRLCAIRHAGFNTVVLPCPWALHEIRPGRVGFAGNLAVRSVLERCADLGLWVILKAGPVIGAPYEGGGLPAWLSDVPGVRLRQPDPIFFERVTAWYSAISRECASLLATDGASAGMRARRPGAETGPVIAIQVEDDWRCAQEDLAETYLSELVRFAREVGFAVPVLTANASFAVVDAAIDTLEVGGDALALMRQLAALRPNFPRFAVVNGESAGAADACALALAGGAQLILRDASGQSVPTGGLPAAVRRIAAFASSFGQVFAQASVTRTPIVCDPSGGDAEASNAASQSVVPVAGDGGTALFVFRQGPRRKGTMPVLLADGQSLAVSLGTAPASWFLFGADVGGRSRLDFASVSPFALVGRSLLVFVGSAGDDAVLSIDGTVLELKVPASSAGPKPTVARVGDVTVVLCNETQADAALLLDDAIVIGAASLADGRPAPLAAGFRGAVRISGAGELKPLAKDAVVAERPVPAPLSIGGWVTMPAIEFADGTSHRYASLMGPSSLAACGAREGYGWYRASFRRAAAGKLTLHAPELADRATLWLDGTLVGTFGRGAERFPVEVKVTAGQHSLVLLVETGGRPTRGNHVGRRTGLFGPVFEVAPVKGAAKVEREVRVNPFALGFVYELHPGDARPGIALTWKIAQRKAPTFLLDLSDAARAVFTGGTVTFNGTPVARWNADGPEGNALPIQAAKIVLPKSSTKAARAAAAAAEPVTAPVELRLILDGEPSEAELATLVKGASLYEVVGDAGGIGSYAFARWSPPLVWSQSAGKAPKSMPTWMQAAFTLGAAPSDDGWLEASGVGRGSALLNGRTIGRFDSSMRLFVPASALVAGENELVLFDEQGTPPKGLVVRWI